MQYDYEIKSHIMGEIDSKVIVLTPQKKINAYSAKKKKINT